MQTLRGPTMKDTVYQQQVNAITCDVLAVLEEEKAQMMQPTESNKQDILQALEVVANSTPPLSDEDGPSPQKRKCESVNGTSKDNIQL